MAENVKEQQYGNDGEVLVFLHYFGGSAESWKWVTDKLSDKYLCVALNLPGFGGSPAMGNPTIEGFAEYVQKELDSLGITTYTLIGHSMGGKIAMQIAINDSKAFVRQLILVAPSPPTTEPLSDDEKKHMLNHPNLKEAERSVDRAIKQPLTEQQYKLAIETQLISDETTWRWWILQGMKHSIAEKAKLLELPITVLASEDDPVMTSDVINQRVMPVLKKAKLITTRQVGHLSPLEAPEWIAAQIRNIVPVEKAK